MQHVMQVNREMQHVMQVNLGVAVAVPLPGGVVVHVRVRDGYGAWGCGHDTPKVRCQAISIRYM